MGVGQGTVRGRMGMNRIKINYMKHSKNKLLKRKKTESGSSYRLWPTVHQIVSLAPHARCPHHGSTLSVRCFLGCYSGCVHVLTPMAYKHELNWKRSLWRCNRKGISRQGHCGWLSALNTMTSTKTEGQVQNSGTESRALCMLGKPFTNWATAPSLGLGFCFVSCVYNLWNTGAGGIYTSVYTAEANRRMLAVPSFSASFPWSRDSHCTWT